MISDRRLTQLIVLFGAIAATSTARAERDFDPRYPFIATAQRDIVERRIAHILSPTITFPALVVAGQRFIAVVKGHRGPTGEQLVPADPQQWTVYLSVPTDPGPVAPAPAKAKAKARPMTAVVVPVTAIEVTDGDLYRVEVAVPVTLARDVYDLRIVTRGIDDEQPNAVRVLGLPAPPGRPRRYRVAVMTDHQLWDPSYRVYGREKNAGLYPKPEEARSNEVITEQIMSELVLHDVDFALHTGDLIFGLNYPREYTEARALLSRYRLPIFAVPGNHDAYAVYSVRLRGNALTVVAGAMRCRKHLSDGELTWGRAWLFISCVYGDVKKLLYADLQRDGLVYWRRQLGPPSYAFDLGKLRFVALNTYAGTPERRHAFSIYVDIADLHLGAPAVDNYGGYLTDEQLSWVASQFALAEKAGQKVVLFAHHDPRGNSDGQRYHENEAFPTDPVSSKGFEQWNYEAKTWDSDPKDKRGVELTNNNSGTRLLALLARYGGYYLFGHEHADGHQIYERGRSLGPHKVARRIEFIRTTTAASSVAEDDSYWGYRLIQIEGDRLRAVDYDPKRRLGSLPAGNLWLREVAAPATKPGAKKPAERTQELELGSTLPHAAPVVVRWSLPRRPGGYRFRLRPLHDARVAFDARVKPVVREVIERGDRQIFSVGVEVPAAPRWPPQARWAVRGKLRALAARDNRPPTPVIDIAVAAKPRAAEPLPVGDAGGDGGTGAGGKFDAMVGQPVLLSAERSIDAENDRIIAYWWTVSPIAAGPAPRSQATPRAEFFAGPRIAINETSPGARLVRLTLVDEAGARSDATRTVVFSTPPPPVMARPGCQGCCAGQDRRLLGGVGVAATAVLLGGAWMWLRRRRRRQQNANIDDST